MASTPRWNLRANIIGRAQKTAFCQGTTEVGELSQTDRSGLVLDVLIEDRDRSPWWRSRGGVPRSRGFKLAARVSSSSSSASSRQGLDLCSILRTRAQHRGDSIRDTCEVVWRVGWRRAWYNFHTWHMFSRISPPRFGLVVPAAPMNDIGCFCLSQFGIIEMLWKRSKQEESRGAVEESRANKSATTSLIHH